MTTTTTTTHNNMKKFVDGFDVVNRSRRRRRRIQKHQQQVLFIVVILGLLCIIVLGNIGVDNLFLSIGTGSVISMYTSKVLTTISTTTTSTTANNQQILVLLHGNNTSQEHEQEQESIDDDDKQGRRRRRRDQDEQADEEPLPKEDDDDDDSIKNDSTNNNSNNTATDIDKKKKTRISMIVKLGGEMANNLSYLAHAYTTKWLIERTNPTLDISIVVEHQDSSKWTYGRDIIKRCFPKLQHINFKSGIWDKTYKLINQIQQNIYQPNGYDNVDYNNNNNDDDDDDDSTSSSSSWRNSLQFIERVLEMQRSSTDIGRNETMIRDLLQHIHEQQSKQLKKDKKKNKRKKSTTKDIIISTPSVVDENNNEYDSRITLPFLRSERMSTFDVRIDEFYDKIRDLFTMDEKRCCSQHIYPEMNESIFHYRNFASEGKYITYRGYEELEPNRTAIELLGRTRTRRRENDDVEEDDDVVVVVDRLQPGDRITIVTRFPYDKSVQRYLNAFIQQGYNATILKHDNDSFSKRSSAMIRSAYDFCYMRSIHGSGSTLYASRVSTYANWAGLLTSSSSSSSSSSEDSKFVYYMINSTNTRRTKTNMIQQQPYHWKYATHLNDRIIIQNEIYHVPPISSQ